MHEDGYFLTLAFKASKPLSYPMTFVIIFLTFKFSSAMTNSGKIPFGFSFSAIASLVIAISFANFFRWGKSAL
ncbi:ATPase [Flavobacterium psychrophilum]|nr:ATPase [Flavobacterium psychrophilum]